MTEDPINDRTISAGSTASNLDEITRLAECRSVYVAAIEREGTEGPTTRWVEYQSSFTHCDPGVHELIVHLHLGEGCAEAWQGLLDSAHKANVDGEVVKAMIEARDKRCARIVFYVD